VSLVSVPNTVLASPSCAKPHAWGVSLLPTLSDHADGSDGSVYESCMLVGKSRISRDYVKLDILARFGHRQLSLDALICFSPQPYTSNAMACFLSQPGGSTPSLPISVPGDRSNTATDWPSATRPPLPNKVTSLCCPGRTTLLVCAR